MSVMVRALRRVAQTGLKLNPEQNTTDRPQKHGVSVLFRSGFIRSGCSARGLRGSARVWSKRLNVAGGRGQGWSGAGSAAASEISKRKVKPFRNAK